MNVSRCRETREKRASKIKHSRNSQTAPMNLSAFMMCLCLMMALCQLIRCLFFLCFCTPASDIHVRRLTCVIQPPTTALDGWGRG